MRAARRRIVGAVLMLVAVVSRERVASSQPRTPVNEEARRGARDLYDAGVKHYNVRDYDRAIESFKQAYLLWPSAGLLYNLAQSYRQKGPASCGEAADFYRSYLRERPDAPDRREVETKVAETERCAAADRRSSTPPPREVDGAGAPSTVASPRPVSSAPPRSKLLLWIAGGGAVVALAGGVLYGSALSKYRSLEDECPCPPDRWEPWQTVTYVSYGLLAAGGVIAASALTWYFVQPRSPASTAAAGVALTPWGISVHGSLY
jgi:tetratricopeptide (TPR) repeat protein